jgi:hypothetical protein
MQQLLERPMVTRDAPPQGGDPRRDDRDKMVSEERPRRRGADTVALRDVGILAGASAVWAGYLWVHIAGAIKLFGRP